MAELKLIVRIMNTDLNGNKKLFSGMRKIKGVNFMFANAVCYIANISKDKRIGELTDSEIAKLEDVMKNPSKIPTWMLNRRKDYDEGTNVHLYAGDIKFVVSNDIKRLKKIRAYRGVRHSLGQPTRGQRTKSHSRKNKGKSLGVKKPAK